MYGKSDFDHYKWAFNAKLKPICTSCKGMSDKSVTVATTSSEKSENYPSGVHLASLLVNFYLCAFVFSSIVKVM